MLVRAKFNVTGMVQGVGFRHFAYRNAASLGLTGFVKNQITGQVECIVEGDKTKVHEFFLRLQQGPSAAHVTEVETEWQTFLGEFQAFEVRF